MQNEVFYETDMNTSTIVEGLNEKYSDDLYYVMWGVYMETTKENDEIICDFTPIDLNSMTGYKEGELVDFSKYRIIDRHVHKSWIELSLIIAGLRNWNSGI